MDIWKSASKFSEVSLPNILRRRWRHADSSAKQFIISSQKQARRRRENIYASRVMSKWVFMEVLALMMLTSRGWQLKTRLEWIFPKNSLTLVAELGGCLLSPLSTVAHTDESLHEPNFITGRHFSPAIMREAPLACLLYSMNQHNSVLFRRAARGDELCNSAVGAARSSE